MAETISEYSDCEVMGFLSEKDLDIILIGKTGNGKSSTGNSIINGEVFPTSYNTTSNTQHPMFDWCKIEGRVIHVVDSPGVIDTGCNTEEGVDLVKKALQYAMWANPGGYHAFIVVIKFALRYTAEEQKAIDILKTILGNDFLREFGIIVMSNGDTFEYECKQNPNFNLETFCREQEGAFQDLLRECNNRIVVFNNITTHTKIRKRQVRDLIKVIDELKTNKLRYTNENFIRAQEVQDYIKNLPQSTFIEKDILKEYSLTLQKIKNFKPDGVNEYNFFKEMSLSIEKFVMRLEKNKQNKDILNKLIENVKSLRANIKQRENTYYKLKQIENDCLLNKEDKLKQINDVKKEISVLQFNLNDIQMKYKYIKWDAERGFFENVRVLFERLGNFIIETGQSIKVLLKTVVLYIRRA